MSVRTRWLSVCATVATAALAVPAASALAAPQLPDLGMARLRDFRIETSPTGAKLLKYTAIIVNVGSGRFQVEGQRPTTSSPMVVSQRVFDSNGTSVLFPTTAGMFFAGDGHFHWHVADLELGYLVRPKDNKKIRALAKHGFCFYDNVKYRLTLPGAPPAAVYTGCGHDASALSVTTGISIGWGDAYYWNTANQWIDITGVPNGRYRITSEFNGTLGFQQSSTANDQTWVDIRLKGSQLTIVGYGPNA